MPLYEFQCPTCGGIAEVRRTMDGRTAPLYCDGTAAFDHPDEALSVDVAGDAPDAHGHNVVEMKRIMSRLAVARVVGKRYA